MDNICENWSRYQWATFGIPSVHTAGSQEKEGHGISLEISAQQNYQLSPYGGGLSVLCLRYISIFLRATTCFRTARVLWPPTSSRDRRFPISHKTNKSHRHQLLLPMLSNFQKKLEDDCFTFSLKPSHSKGKPFAGSRQNLDCDVEEWNERGHTLKSTFRTVGL